MAGKGRIKDHWREQQIFEQRALIAGVLIVLLTGALIARLGWLQISRNAYFTELSQGNRVRIEPRFGDKVLAELKNRGHDLDIAPDWSEGFVSAAQYDGDTGMLEAGCDPRGAKSECFPAFATAW